MRGHLVRAMVRVHVPKQTLKSRLHSPLAPSSSLFHCLLSACFNSRHFLSCVDVLLAVLVVIAAELVVIGRQTLLLLLLLFLLLLMLLLLCFLIIFVIVV